MRLPGALVMLLVAEVFFAHATLNSLLKPFQSLLGWHRATKTENASLGTEDRDAAHDRSKVKQEVDHWTAVGSSKIFAPKLSSAGEGTKDFALLLEDFNTTASSEPTKVSSPADSPDQTALSSKLATTTTPSSGHSTSVASPTDPSTSVRSKSALTAEAKSFHMVDLKIPGGENPETETLPDVASFEPNKPPKSADTETEKLSELSDAESEGLKDESPSINREVPLSSILLTTSTPTAAPPTPATNEIAVIAASHETAPASRSTTEESTRESDRFRSFQQPAQSFVFQDVNDLFQSDD